MLPCIAPAIAGASHKHAHEDFYVLFSHQIANLIASLAKAAVSAKDETRADESLEDFSPTDIVSASPRILQENVPSNLVADGIVRAWLPSVQDLVAMTDLPSLNTSENAVIRDFSDLVSRFDSPPNQHADSQNELDNRADLSERSLSLSDFRHAVDHHIDHASSIWDHN